MTDDRACEALRERLAEHRLHASLNICTCGDWRYIVADAGSLAEQHEAHRANALLPAVEAEKAAAAKAFAPVAAYLDGLDGFYGDDPIDDVLDTPTGSEADDGCALRLSDLRNVRAALAGEREGGGLRPCVGCGVELDADDRHDRCDDCEGDEASVPVALDLDDPYYSGQSLPDLLSDYTHVHSITGVCVKHPTGDFCATLPAPTEGGEQ